MRHRTLLAAVLSMITVLGLVAACSADGGSGVEQEGRPRVQGPAPRDPVRPQVIRAGTRLVSCDNGAEGTARRLGTVLLPLGYTADYLAFTTTEIRREERGPEAGSVICSFARVTPMEFRLPRQSAFAVTLPTQQPLGQAVRRFAVRRGPRPVVEQVPVLGSPRGARATYRARDSVTGRLYDAVAVQAGGVRLTWLGPTRPGPGWRAADRRLWRQLQDSLAVRVPASFDGDDDAESDADGPAEPTTVLTPFDPAGATSHPGFRTERCTRRQGAVTLLVPNRLPDRGRCTWFRPLPASWDGEGIDVVLAPRTSLREEYETEKAQEAAGGDAATSHLEYDNDVAGPGGLRAESLVFTRANDGVPQEYHLIQSGGVRLRWTVQPGTWGPQLDELPIVLGSLGVLS